MSNGAALELASRGYDIIACVDNYPQLRSLKIKSKELGVPIRIKKLDVTREGGRRTAADSDVDMLVNGAWIIEGGAIIDVPSDTLRRQLEVNVIGNVAVAQHVARKMTHPSDRGD